MKKAFYLIIPAFLLFACSSDDSSEAVNDGINQSFIYGTWYPNPDNPLDYASKYFGEDGVYIQDQSNFGLGQGVGQWEWVDDHTLKVTPVSGIVGGSVEAQVFKLTADSLVFISSSYRYSHTPPQD
ncbi:hypothetical protein FUA48_11435 [Flavobacterium alkalisoli]|uniref:Lipocalin-like domain-containing protein n=1 Tax=Flavobacterium alkalisoli TaxID=2602769 RepID=A0A5B9FZH0_9FLAO|nr:hypothetical protein [Flavobacterium alkalisoli]QEE50167.1 hypothetical protein FUA48_11435 [Flavobacterium alkalisoli]